MGDGIIPVSIVVIVYGSGTCTLTPNHDFRGIAAKVSNVVSDPFERNSLVQQSQILFASTCGIRETHDVHAIVDGDYYMLLGPGYPALRQLTRHEYAIGLESITERQSLLLGR